MNSSASGPKLLKGEWLRTILARYAYSRHSVYILSTPSKCGLVAVIELREQSL